MSVRTLDKVAEQRRDDVVHYVASFTAISKRGDKIHVRKGVGELMHALGYYADQHPNTLRDLPPAERINMMADVLAHIAEHLDDA